MADISASPVLKVSNLKKSYKEIVAVDGISFQVQPNEIVGLLGPNGAGKTTTINMILGTLEPTDFRLIYRKVVRDGLIARYSAESGS